MAASSRSRKSRWLGPALGAGIGVGLAGAGFGEFAPAGARFGGWLGNTIKTATGFGEYHVRSNALYEGSSVPFVRNEPTANGTTISHREYIMDVVTAPFVNTWSSQTFALNPALGSTFEWLAQVAANYEEYVLEGCIFVFRSMSADALNSTNTALGTVIMATQYNTYQPPFVNKAEMESHAYSMSGKPSVDMVHPIECDPHQSSISTFFTRNADVPAGADQRLYDVGRFEIATTGFQAASTNIGELHVTYQVTLMKPRLWSALGRAAPFYHGHNDTWIGVQPLGVLPMIRDPSSTITPQISYSPAGSSTFTTIIMPAASSPLVFKFSIYQDSSVLQALNWAASPVALTGGDDVTADYMGTNLEQPDPLLASNMHHVQRVVKTRGDYFPCTIVFSCQHTITDSTNPVHLLITQFPNV